MRLAKVNIENYKSLKNVTIVPAQISLIVGANASGKSNFADCVDFISEVYQHGLEVAVSRKGGYDNIAFRRVRRSKRPIKISLCVDLSPSDLRYYGRRRRSKESELRFEHSFSFVARGYSIRAEFEVVSEQLVISTRQEKEWSHVATVTRNGKKVELDLNPEIANREDDEPGFSHRNPLFDFTTLEFLADEGSPLSATELFTSTIGRFSPGIYAFMRALQSVRVFQISPTRSREVGVPTPTPELDRWGSNLPAVIDTLKKKNEREWNLVLQSVRYILPELKDIEVNYTPSRTLGLFFEEEGAGRPWSVDEVSDGTIQTLALLVAIFDPESKALLIEEPENSVHPWIIRHLIDACREASRDKQIIITTHSPVVINSAKPEETWVIWRSDGESHLSVFSELDKDFFEMWQGGAVSTFEYIDSGALIEAIPPAPSGHVDSEEE